MRPFHVTVVARAAAGAAWEKSSPQEQIIAGTWRAFPNVDGPLAIAPGAQTIIRIDGTYIAVKETMHDIAQLSAARWPLATPET